MVFSLNSLSVPALRTLCNDNGMSCKGNDGKYLPKEQIIALLQPIIARGTRVPFPGQKPQRKPSRSGMWEQWTKNKDASHYVFQGHQGHQGHQTKRNPRDPLPPLP